MADGSKKKKADARIFLVDDHPIVRKGLAGLINAMRGLSVCGEAGTVREALRAIPDAKPDLAVVDLSLKDESGIGLIRDLGIRHPEVRILVVSMHDESLYAERVLKLGAKGYVAKQEATEHLEEALRRVLAGKIYVSEQMSERLVGKAVGAAPGAEDSPLKRLTDRELEVFELIGRGTGTRAIAEKLSLSVKTVETHRANIKEKLGLRDAVELVQYAGRWVARL
ncbi:MAG: response regulator [Planctomycetota bacterium]|jgi:DNA-binding NarL/FixJ family response regulator